MTTIFKNFIYILKRFKTSSILNLLGLSAAFSVFIVLAIQVYYDFTYDRNFKNADEIYLMSYYYPERDKHTSAFNTAFGEKRSAQTPLIDEYVTMNRYIMSFYDKDKSANEAVWESFTKMRGNFIDMFTPRVIEGDLKQGLAEGNEIAISQKVAKKLYGEESAIGKTIIHAFDGSKTYTIRAVIEDFPENCSLKNGLFGYLPTDMDIEWSYTTYVKVSNKNIKQFRNYLNSENYFKNQIQDQPEGENIGQYKASAIPLTSIHLQYPERGNGDQNTTLALLGIAILTLAIAYTNFINFSIAMAPARVKTLNIQRIFGQGKFVQRGIVATESLMFSILAFLIALVFVSLIKMSPIHELFVADLSLGANIKFIALIAFFIAILGLTFGLYPAKYITGFDSLEALKGTNNSVQSSKLRNVLITIQFMAAITLIIITAFIKIQHSYMINYSWGIQKDNIVFIDMENKKVKYRELGEELKKDPRILDFAISQNLPGNVQMEWGLNWLDKNISLKAWHVSDNFLQFFGAEMASGEDFPSLNNPQKTKMIFNETFMKKHGFTVDEVIGKDFSIFGFTDANVMGVVKDINFESLKTSIYPMTFVTMQDEWRNRYLFVKLSGTDTKGAVGHVGNIWKQFSTDDSEIHFLDENLEKLYRNENNLAKLVGIFSLITILIAIMGVYGMITFNTRYRAKEIAVRKVNGAEEIEIMIMINKGVLVQLLIGFILAVPFSYYVVDKWLSNFAFHTNIHWWIFPLAGIVVLLITIVAVSYQSYKAAVKNPIDSLKSE